MALLYAEMHKVLFPSIIQRIKMITHELFGQHLRAGNFLFKYAWSVSMKEKLGIDTKFPDYYLWKYLLKPPQIDNLPRGEIIRPRRWEWTIEEEAWLNSHDFTLDKQIALNFFFQSEQWFRGYEQKVYDALKFKRDAIKNVKNKYSYLFNSARHCPTIGIGIRLGDFIGHGDFYQIPVQWYLNTLEEHFPYWRERKVMVFSDDIELSKKLFKGYPFYYAEPNNTQTHSDNFKHYHGDASEHLILGSLMDDFIIGNSTFSWWQAWLATYNKPLSMVIHTGKVFSEKGSMKHVDTSCYYPKNWMCFGKYIS